MNNNNSIIEILGNWNEATKPVYDQLKVIDTTYEDALYNKVISLIREAFNKNPELESIEIGAMYDDESFYDYNYYFDTSCLTEPLLNLKQLSLIPTEVVNQFMSTNLDIENYAFIFKREDYVDC